MLFFEVFYYSLGGISTRPRAREGLVSHFAQTTWVVISRAAKPLLFQRLYKKRKACVTKLKPQNTHTQKKNI